MQKNLHSIYGVIFILLLVCFQNSYAQTANFTVSIPSKQGCSPLSINFTDASSGGIVATRTWDLGNAVIITNGLSTTGANYITAGKYYITLTVLFTNGVTNTKLDSIIVHPKPVADFKSADSVGCVTHTANFLSQSTTATGTLTNYQWDFGAGGITGTNPSPSFSYTVAGLYQVSLIVKNSWGCVSNAETKPQYIKVFPPPNAYFTVNTNFSCTNSLTVIFTNASTGGDPSRNTYEWDFGDASPIATTINATHLYNTTGNYTATLKVKLGSTCVNSYSYPIYVGKPTPTIVTFPNPVCVNNSINFVGTGSPNTYYLRWYFVDNNTTEYYGNVNHTFTTAGTYEIILIARNVAGCEDTARRNIVVKPGPQISFVPDLPNSACVSHTVIFTNNTVGSNLKFAWNYGDGTPVDTINGNGNATHTYANFGTYQVTVYAKDTSTAAGCFAYKTYDYIRIYQPSVTLAVVPPNGCLPLPVILNATVYNPSGTTILNYTWNFGDGSPLSTTTVPTNFHIYNTAGSFSATVTINMQGGCSYPSAIKIVSVIALCDDDGSGGGGGAGGGGFTIGKTCADKYTIVFTDTVTNNIPLSWDFGDGNPPVTSGILNPITHTFTPPQKIYIVKVTRKDSITNIITSSQKRIKIIDEKANFIPNIFDICKDKNVLFSTIGIDTSLIKKYTWDFGDGTVRQIIDNTLNFYYYGTYLNGNTNHTYTTNGIFFVKLIIEDKLGCLDSLQYAVPIKVAGPIARFSGGPLTSCTSPLVTTFTDASIQNGSTPITEWQWTFGDASPSLTTTVDSLIPHTYLGGTPAIFYNVKLKIKDAIGCEADTTRISYVRLYKPVADFFSYNTLQCNNYQVLMYGYTSQAVNPTYQWDFGNGTVTPYSSLYYQYYAYPTDGNYNIKLVIKDENGCKDSITKIAYINIVKPVADFKINDTLQCAPASITFADSSKYATTFLWDFGDGSGPSTAPNPAPHIYGTPGFYDVKLTITGPNGCIDTKIKRIRVRGPIGNLSVGASQGCRPFTLPLNITGGNFISTYAWDYGDGTPVVASTTGANINHVYNFAGKYLPNIVLTSVEGCPFTLKVTDTIFVDSLRAKFTTPKNTFCQTSTSQTVNFTNLTALPSFSTLLNSTWNFGDGSTLSSSSASVSHTYTGYGTFYPYVATKSKYGCIDTFRLAQPIVINAKPIPTITGSNVYCLKPLSILTYSGTTVSPNPIVKYIWKIDADSVANTQNLNINYRIPGTHTLRYIVFTNFGCVDSVDKTIIIDSIITKFSNAPLQFCGPKLVTFTNQTTQFAATQNFYWSFGDGSSLETNNLNPQHLYGLTGSYNVKLFMQTINGCKDSITKNAAVVIDSIPKATINGAAVFCLKPASVLQFSSAIVTQNPIVTYRWYIDNAPVGNSNNLNINYRTAGTHTISLFVQTNKGCTDSVFKTFIVDSIVANFSNAPLQFCGPKLVTFTNQTTQFAATQNFYWSFGDGSSLETNNLNPQHLYGLTGSYNVKLFMQTINGCKDSITKNAAVVIDSIPKAIITGNDLECKPVLYNYLSSASISQNAIATYQWKVDGIIRASTPNLNYYFNAGNHIINLKIISINGCEKDTSKNIIIDSLKVIFVPTDTKICGNFANVQFINTGGGQFAVSNYTWNFGDNQNSNLPTPLHYYAQPGEYDVKLKLFSINGCSDSLTIVKAVKIYKKPLPTINGAALQCATGNYTYTVTDANNTTISNYLWKVNGINAGTTSSLNYNFSPAGIYTLNVKLTTTNGCDTTIERTIKIDSLFKNFSVNTPQICGDNGSVIFTNSAFAHFGISNYKWNFGDNTLTSASPNPTHFYANIGEYDVKLIITSTTNCKDSITIIKAVKIYKKPVANIIGDALKCSPATYIYTSAINTINPITIYNWKVNNIDVSNTQNLSYNFNAGLKDLTLFVTTDKGCKDTAYKQVKIDSLVSAFTIPNPIKCGVPSTISFSQNAFAQFGIATYLWNFGNGSTINNILPNPTSTYNAAGVFPVEVKIKSTTGCEKTSTQLSNVTIYAAPTIVISGLASECANTTLTFKATITSSDVVTSKEWKINNVVVVSTGDSINYLFTTAGTYIITCNVKTQYGCDVTKLKTVIINPLPIPAAAPNTTICLGSSVTLSATDGNIFSWTPNDASIVNAASPSPIVTPNIVGDKKYYVLVTNQFGCKKTDSVLIKTQQPVSLTASADVTICENGKTQLNANGNTSIFKWSPATGLSNAVIKNPTASPLQTTEYTVVGYSNNVCKNDTAKVIVTIQPTPTVNAGPDIVTNGGATVQLNATASSTVINYNWTPSNKLSCTNCPNPRFIDVDKSTTFRVNVYTQYGCTNYDDITVSVLCGKGAVYIPNAFTPNGDNKNDRFSVVGYGVGKVKSFTIFNRYGQVVFQRKEFVPTLNDKINSWDGKINGQNVEVTTTYVYVAEITCDSGETFVLKNTVLLIR